ncbi:hypothetical protein K8R43_02300 [archaeon]|nr:hypothetical protein [archaeon]
MVKLVYDIFKFLDTTPKMSIGNYEFKAIPRSAMKKEYRDKSSTEILKMVRNKKNLNI